VILGNTTDNPYLYVGQLGYYTHWMDSALADMLHLGVRFYEPGVGRFGQHGSPYTYADSNPTLKAGDGRLRLAPKPKPKPVPRPKPKLGRGGGKAGGLAMYAALAATGTCAAALIHHIAVECGANPTHWTRDCVCDALESLLKGLDELWNDCDKWYKKIPIAIGNECAKTGYDAVDKLLNCSSRD